MNLRGFLYGAALLLLPVGSVKAQSHNTTDETPKRWGNGSYVVNMDSPQDTFEVRYYTVPPGDSIPVEGGNSVFRDGNFGMKEVEKPNKVDGEFQVLERQKEGGVGSEVFTREVRTPKRKVIKVNWLNRLFTREEKNPIRA